MTQNCWYMALCDKLGCLVVEIRKHSSGYSCHYYTAESFLLVVSTGLPKLVKLPAELVL